MAVSGGRAAQHTSASVKGDMAVDVFRDASQLRAMGRAPEATPACAAG
jgi:hypothetical protein